MWYSIACSDAKSLPLFNSSPAIIRLAVMMYVRFPLSLRQVEDLLSERGIDFGPLSAAEIRKRRIHLRSHSNWRWHLDEVFCADQWGDALSVACR